MSATKAVRYTRWLVLTSRGDVKMTVNPPANLTLSDVAVRLDIEAPSVARAQAQAAAVAARRRR